MSEEERRQIEAKVEQMLQQMFETPLLNLEQLRKAMNYSSASAIRQAISKGTFPISTFKLSGRRGHFVLLSDVAKYLSQQAIKDEGGGKSEMKY
jgi:hypothetical protein